MAKAKSTKPQKRRPHMTAEERARALELVESGKATPSDVARDLGRYPSTIKRLCDSAAVKYAEVVQEHEAEAVRHALDNVDATCSELSKVLDATIDALRYTNPDGTKDPSRPYRVTAREIPLIQALNQTAGTLGKFRGWAKTTQEITGAGGGDLIPRRFEVVIVDANDTH